MPGLTWPQYIAYLKRPLRLQTANLKLKICIVSDSHDRSEPLAAAITYAHAAGAEAVIHCGDLIGANTLRASLKLGLPMHVIHGNNLGDMVAIQRLMAKSEGKLIYHGMDASITLGGKKIFVTHYPHYAQGMACTGDYDLVCCGHSHIPEVVYQANIKGGKTLLVNPGTVAGMYAPNVQPAYTWAMGDLASMTFEIRTMAQ